ncbi:MAG: hypothetical protein FJY07_08290 [Bacteroidetes bacterium]|nr:hypothetical protein [Bacteroidota bacterium]
MKRFYFGIFLILMALNSIAQSSKEDLLKDVVKIVNGKFTLSDFALVSSEDGSNLQIKFYCESPSQGVISRDYFNQIVATLQIQLIQEVLGQVEIKNIPEITGNPDIEFNVYMSKTGIQVEVKSDGETNRNILMWEDIF